MSQYVYNPNFVSSWQTEQELSQPRSNLLRSPLQASASDSADSTERVRLLEQKLAEYEDELRMRDHVNQEQAVRIKQQEATIQVQSQQVSGGGHNKYAQTILRLPSKHSAQQDTADSNSSTYHATPHIVSQHNYLPPHPMNTPSSQQHLATSYASPTTRSIPPCINVSGFTGSLCKTSLNDTKWAVRDVASSLSNSCATSISTNVNCLILPKSHASAAPSDTGISSYSQARSAISIISMPQLSEVNEVRVAQKLMALFDTQVAFAFRHVNHPSTELDRRAPQPVKDIVMKAVLPARAFPLMSSQHTRYLVVAKVIFDWLYCTVFQIEAFFGLVTGADQEIIKVKRAIRVATSRNGAQDKAKFEQEMAWHFHTICVSPRFIDYLNHLSHRREDELFNQIKHLVHLPSDGVRQDMYDVVRKAHVVAAEIFNDRAQFRFEFPPIGTYFSEATMVNMGSFNPESDRNLEFGRQLLVAAAITPRVARCDQGKVSVLTKACVLTKG